MKETRKKILGFAGLGLVAAITTVAASLPAPSASAVADSSITDTILLRVIPKDPDIVVSSTSGTEISTPRYNYSVIYNGVSTINAVLVNRDGSGNIVFEKELWSVPDADWEPGTWDEELDLNDYGGYGNYTITVTGVGSDGVPVERILTVKYAKEGDQNIDGGEITVDPETGEGTVDTEVPQERVESLVINIYNDGGDKVKGPISINYPGDVENIDLSDLDDGVYTGEIIKKDGEGNIIDIEYITIVVDKDGAGESIKNTVKDEGKEINKVVMTLKDENGNIVKVETVDHPNPGDEISLDLTGVPAGTYTLITDYYDNDNNIIDSIVSTVIISGKDGHIDMGVDTKADTVTKVQADIYDEDGNLVRVIVGDRETGTVTVYDENGNPLFTIPNGYSDEDGLKISLDGLTYGEYTVTVSYKNKYGSNVGNTYTYRVSYYGSVPVPDTGSFFQGLNISREDYLITGLVVFAIVGVVAFGVIRRNHNNKTTKRSRR